VPVATDLPVMPGGTGGNCLAVQDIGKDAPIAIKRKGRAGNGWIIHFLAPIV
jgi:hypothetical protein